MSLLGAHQSIAGGLHKAVTIGHETGCAVIQIFTKNTNQWRARPIAPQEAERFRQALAEHRIACPLAHDSYLINLASPDDELWRKSIDAMIDELLRAEMLGIPWVVMHPGAFTTGTEEGGLRRVTKAVREVLRQTRGQRVGLLLETTAGQGSAIGWRFEHLATVLDAIDQPERTGVCFDTCHVFAAGYGLSTRSQYRTTMAEFNQTIGLDRLRAFHLNDSVRPRGSRIDRHARIGHGQLGFEAFRLLLRDRRFRQVPMVLETPKCEIAGEAADVVNLRALRELAG